MISEFLALSEKVTALAEMTQALRRENAELRQRLIAMGEENADLAQRMQQAHKRVALLLDKLPLGDDDEQEAA